MDSYHAKYFLIAAKVWTDTIATKHMLHCGQDKENEIRDKAKINYLAMSRSYKIAFSLFMNLIYEIACYAFSRWPVKERFSGDL